MKIDPQSDMLLLSLSKPLQRLSVCLCVVVATSILPSCFSDNDSNNSPNSDAVTHPIDENTGTTQTDCVSNNMDCAP